MSLVTFEAIDICVVDLGSDRDLIKSPYDVVRFLAKRLPHLRAVYSLDMTVRDVKNLATEYPTLSLRERRLLKSTMLGVQVKWLPPFYKRLGDNNHTPCEILVRKLSLKKFEKLLEAVGPDPEWFDALWNALRSTRGKEKVSSTPALTVALARCMIKNRTTLMNKLLRVWHIFMRLLRMNRIPTKICDELAGALRELVSVAPYAQTYVSDENALQLLDTMSRSRRSQGSFFLFGSFLTYFIFFFFPAKTGSHFLDSFFLLLLLLFSQCS
jgi:hypothetical protein